LRVRRCLDFFDFLDGAFAGEHDEATAEFAGEFHAGGAGDGHLGRGMNRKIGREPADQPVKPRVLYNHRVNAR